MKYSLSSLEEIAKLCVASQQAIKKIFTSPMILFSLFQIAIFLIFTVCAIHCDNLECFTEHVAKMEVFFLCIQRCNTYQFRTYINRTKMRISEFFKAVNNIYLSKESFFLFHTIRSLTVPLFTEKLSKIKYREMTQRPHYLIVSLSRLLISIIQQDR